MSLLYHSLTGEEIEKLNKDALFITYPELNNINNINTLFKYHNKIIILYLLNSKYSGHYVCLFKQPKNEHIFYFDSFGVLPDYHFDILPKEARKEYNEKQNKLLSLLNKYKNYSYNNIIFQNYKYQSCGFWVTFRLMNTDLNDEEFIYIFSKNNIKTPDIFIINYILNNKK